MDLRHLAGAINVIAACLALAPAQAADTVPADAFARHPQYQSAALSPDGRHLAVATPFEDRISLAIVQLDGDYAQRVMRYGPKELVSTVIWADDGRVVVDKALQQGFLATPGLTGDIIAVDVDATNQQHLFGYEKDNGNRHAKRKDEGWARIVGALRDAPGDILVSFQPWAQGHSDISTALFRINTHTGARKELARVPYANAEIFTDNAGAARLVVAEDGAGTPILRYRARPDDDWQVLPKAIAGRSIRPLRFEQGDNSLYALADDDGEPEALYRIDLLAGTREKLAGDPNQSITSVLMSGRSGKPFAVFYDAGKPQLQYLDGGSEWAQLHAGLMKQFPGKLVDLTDVSRDERKVLLFVYSDRDPGTYYLYERDVKKLTEVFKPRVWIDPARMAPTRSIQFPTSDGRILYGFYTAPPGLQGLPPMVVVPHGGPYEVYDRWGFDPDVQFLANRGYAVLQVNYRGSGGRGERFMRAGDRQWGTRIQDDIADGARWAIAEKLADPARIGIYGGSFGAYSALMNPIRHPGLYRCAIGYVGIYDLSTLYDSGDIQRSRQGRYYLEQVLGRDPAQLAAQSPARQVDKLSVPVLLIQGRSDERAPMAQFDALTQALRKAGKPYETLIKANEGHGFYKVENRVATYQAMEAFLARHLAPAGPRAATSASADVTSLRP